MYIRGAAAAGISFHYIIQYFDGKIKCELRRDNKVAFFEKKAPQKSKAGSYLRADGFFSVPFQRIGAGGETPPLRCGISKT